ncbi:ABC transporter ATP-binding protein [Ruminococcus champanellensis]|uniref:ABC-type multidrug transport system, ATPase and permease components n=1 Tax=Ruminococcus champanellensis (strain DSM 18848 / JCM 17042 / KCTC 15320 / 18P13) TaxID=213810 RepID=D4LES0_RUMC1|nr:ABC transporter ATP-binding protein [Ruminococcus champanellensis]CBL18115.1 ABC-type multidrug transport system, ATPase and permease components [Ruminococcus champanellensis 18P13 = JCM 17042]
MFKLLAYMKNYKKEAVLGPLFKLLEALLELLVPLVIAAVIDTGIAGGNRGYVIRMCLLLVGFGIVGLVFSITAQYFAAKASVGFVTKLRHALFDHIQGLSYTELDTIGTSTLITRMTSDMNQVQSGMNLTLRLLLRSPFVVFGAMIMAFTIDVKAALIFAAAIPVLSLVVFGIMLWCIPLYKRVQRKLDGVLSATRENLTGVRVIRAFCKEEEQISRFDACNQDLTRTQKYVGRISALMNPVTYILINLAIIWLVYTGALRVDVGLISQGAVVALYNYMSQILVELIKLANLIINITKSVACGNRIQSVFEIRSSLDAPEQAPAPKDFSYAVEFDHVTLRYANAGDDSLSDISFAARPGETIGVIGSTGSGKSSLVNLIPRFYDASAGQVLVDGINVKEYPLDDLRNRIGVVPQKAVLFKGTIRDNLRWGNPDATDDQLLEAVQTAQAGEVLAQKGGLDFELEQGGKNLSGGQKQRFTIARALVKHPKILILDDSASALDFATDAALRKAIREMPGNPTVFIVSQRTSSLQHADQILVLEDGAVVGAGTHTQLLESCPVYQEIYQSQFRKEDA